MVGAAHGGDQLGRDRLAVGVAGEGREHVGVPCPLLEHLARRLDEVPLGRDAGEPEPASLSAQDVVHQVAELVEEGDDLVVLHQAAGEVAHQHALRQLALAQPGDHVELGGVLELALAGVQVEVDAPDPPPGQADVVRRHVGVPGAGLVGGDGGPLETEEPAGDVEEALSDRLEAEVGPHDLAVDVVLLPAHELGVVARVVGLDLLGVRLVDALALQQDGQLRSARPRDRAADPVDELGDRGTGADHLHLGVVVGPRVVAQQRRRLAAYGEEVLEHPVVDRPAPRWPRPGTARGAPRRRHRRS